MKTVLSRMKNNLFFVVVILAYFLLLSFHPQTALQGVKNSGYYIKEMLMIMPVIFVLTALLDTWVPKETIIKYLGASSRAKGIVLSFILGSISTGPIYAAFPFCVMLHKKGASIRNIVIILSAWAVVKVPMLINEMKFLGLKFMVVRWGLTILAILAFSWIAAKNVKDKDLPKDAKQEQTGVCVCRDACMGCAVCTKNYPELFAMEGKKATVKVYDTLEMQRLQKTMDDCPVKAIQYIEA